MATSIREVHQELVKVAKDERGTDLSAGGAENEADTFEVVLNAIGRAELAAPMRALLTANQDSPTSLAPADLAELKAKFKTEFVNYV